jgi:hypothetical protein
MDAVEIPSMVMIKAASYDSIPTKSEVKVIFSPSCA